MNLTSQTPQPSLAWNFDGTTSPYTGSLSETNISGTNSYTTGKSNQAISFFNPSASVSNSITYTLTSTINMDSGFTMAVWVKFSNTPGGGGNDACAVEIPTVGAVNGGRLRFVGGSSVLAYNATFYNVNGSMPAYDTWVHYTATILNGTHTFYTNGVLSGTASYPTNGTMSTNMVYAGRSSYYGMDGLIDDLRIYNTALSAAQIQRIYMANGIPSRMAQTGSINSNTLPTFSGYTYIPLRALPTSFTLTQTSTGNAWTYNQASNQIRDGNWGGDAAMTLTASQPNTMYYERQPGIWYRLLGNNINYVRHQGFVMLLDGFNPNNNFDYAWAFFLKNGTTNQVIIWNAFGTVANGSWVQSGTQTSGRIAIKEVTLEQAHIYTLSVPVSPYSFIPILLSKSNVPDTLPQAVTGFTAAPTTSIIDLTWDTALYATSYSIVSDPPTTTKTTSSTFISFTGDDGLIHGTGYTFTITPSNVVGNGPATQSGTIYLVTEASYLTYTGSIETLSLTPGTYTFELAGGAGPTYGFIGQFAFNYSFGSYSSFTAEYTITEPITIQYVIGQASPNSVGGAGGTFIYDLSNSVWLFVAGGGGSQTSDPNESEGDGSGGVTGTSGGSGAGISTNGSGGTYDTGGGLTITNGAFGGGGGTLGTPYPGGFGGGGGGCVFNDYDITTQPLYIVGGGGGYSGGTTTGEYIPGQVAVFNCSPGTSYHIPSSTITGTYSSGWGSSDNGYINIIPNI
jgi:hypothetical protein